LICINAAAYGSFQRSFALPDGVDRDNITADLSKGVLTITPPKTPESQKPKTRIEVKPAADSIGLTGDPRVILCSHSHNHSFLFRNRAGVQRLRVVSGGK
jgi:HSP20 family protein